MKLLKQKEYNLEGVLTALLNQLRIKVTPVTSDRCIQDHPEYPSVLALSDCLSEWNVENQTYRIEKNDYDPKELFFPFLAHLRENGGRFILILNIDDGKVNYSDGQHQELVMTEDELLKKWDGIALHAEKKVDSGEKNYQQHYFNYFLKKLAVPISVVLGITVFILAAISASFTSLHVLLASVKLVGVIVSILLLIQSSDSKNPFIQNLCGMMGKGDCNAILKSDAAQITHYLSWSEVGFFYFAGSFLLLFIYPLSLHLLAWLNVLALPYTMYSIAYQYTRKNWCVLCCSIQIILWLEFLINVTSASYHISFHLPLFYYLPISFLLPVLVWSFLKPLLHASVQVVPLRQQLKKFKYNKNLFGKTLTSQVRYAVSDELRPIILGNPAAETVITMVSNPFCGPCGKAHETLEELLNSRDDLQVKVLFATTGHNQKERTKVAMHLTSLNQLPDKTLVGNALSDWYKHQHKRYEFWAEKYPSNLNDETILAINKQNEWCEMADITFTPTILVNGYKLPQPYHPSDLRYLIE
ncbi:thioredoxin domain-containing protein [Pedobacter sp. ISL-68]|uniref:thioredoxin domain-containing protein n=1 Tax=unclassified Pedobacter TaxID=2628915 RepID=UPI001BEA3041|nr:MULTISPECIES: thioredoxin domain-containing protein [unclassified Pedobacter]MBT2559782.1 thioredoxin domain-containing protein [Pedobacter sp. ISL-64]MBT2592087.1 thioredoxin domain-containing protein [Pedobacter sp. ISL-68]